jgi:hypothetical protein
LGKFFSQLHTNLTINAQDVCKISWRSSCKVPALVVQF